MWYERLIERDVLADWLLRFAIRRRLAGRLRQVGAGSSQEQERRLQKLLNELRDGPIALAVDAANEQHYEVPAAFFEQVLGRHCKYSCGHWPAGVSDLDAAEESMLELTCRRARIRDGMDILDLGCGWGALSLWMAERYPAARITAVSNSGGQKSFIEGKAAERNLTNLQVVRVDVNDLKLERRFDRVVSVEMFEHVRNHERLMANIAGHLKRDGFLFVHIFCHRLHTYLYEVAGPDDWMARYFFTGGMMPSDGLLPRFQRDLTLVDHWRISGTHYGKTCNAWLARMDRHRGAVEPILTRVYGEGETRRWWVRWRLFFMACAELFDYRGGAEWYVSHYLFRKQPA